MEKKKPTYKELEKAYDIALTDLTIFWNKYKPNETYIKKNFLKDTYVRFAKEKKNVKNGKVVGEKENNRKRNSNR